MLYDKIYSISPREYPFGVLCFRSHGSGAVTTYDVIKLCPITAHSCTGVIEPTISLPHIAVVSFQASDSDNAHAGTEPISRKNLLLPMVLFHALLSNETPMAHFSEVLLGLDGMSKYLTPPGFASLAARVARTQFMFTRHCA